MPNFINQKLLRILDIRLEKGVEEGVPGGRCSDP
jgi:hypothetical protein